MEEEQRLLFINQSREEIEEFSKSMPIGKFVIDTAQNGKDARKLIEDNDYGVVILDMQLEGHDSEQIVKNLNRNYPDTICIIYTYNLARAQLNFLLNECKVFRIFLSPANFLDEMYPAINEAFAVYANNFVMQEVDAIDRQLAERRRGIRSRSMQLKRLQKAKKQLASFYEKMLLEAIKMADNKLDTDEKQEIVSEETDLLEKVWEVQADPCSSFEEIQTRLEEEFSGKRKCRELNIELPDSELENGHRYLYEALYMVIWILIRQYWEFSTKNVAKVKIAVGEEQKVYVEFSVSRSVGISEEKLWIPESAVRGIAESFEREDQKEKIIYRLWLKSAGA